MTILTLGVLLMLASPQDANPVAKGGQDHKQAVSDVVRTAVEKVVSVLEDLELSRLEKRKAVIKIIDPLIDFQLLAKLTLGKTEWKKIDTEQREAFTALFVRMLQLSYYEKLELFSDEVVEFEEPTVIPGKGAPKFTVVTYIVSKGERYKVAYHMYLSNKGEGPWRVFDFEIEGVSTRKVNGAQYRDYLQEKSFDELLVELRAKVKKAEEKGADTELADKK